MKTLKTLLFAFLAVCGMASAQTSGYDIKDLSDEIEIFIPQGTSIQSVLALDENEKILIDTVYVDGEFFGVLWPFGAEIFSEKTTEDRWMRLPASLTEETKFEFINIFYALVFYYKTTGIKLYESQKINTIFWTNKGEQHAKLYFPPDNESLLCIGKLD